MRKHFVPVVCSPLFALAALVATAAGTRAQESVADFYRGKTITITIGATPGGGYDVDARVISRHLGRFIPGNPVIVVQNVPGARGLTNINRLYATYRKDGTAMSVVQRGLLTAPWLNPAGVQYDVLRFNWIYSTAAEPGVAILWHTSPHNNVADVRNSEVIIGGSGDSSIIPQVFNYTMGTKFKLVTGYPGTADLVLAIQRGEIQGIGYYSWSNLATKNRNWLEEKKVKILFQTGTKRHKDLPGIPTSAELALDAGKLQIQDLWLAPLETARPYAMPPDVPADRVAAVRNAFAEMIANADFLDDAKKTGMTIDPRSAEDIIAILRRLASTPPAIIEEARKAVQDSGG